MLVLVSTQIMLYTAEGLYNQQKKWTHKEEQLILFNKVTISKGQAQQNRHL